jgi:hypothetical protein
MCVHKGLFAPGVEKQFPHLRGFCEAGKLLLLGTAEGIRPVSTLLYAMAGGTPFRPRDLAIHALSKK